VNNWAWILNPKYVVVYTSILFRLKFFILNEHIDVFDILDLSTV
jgi:hypothetical protein